MEIILVLGLIGILFYGIHKILKYAFWINTTACILLLVTRIHFGYGPIELEVLTILCPLMFLNILMFVFIKEKGNVIDQDRRYTVSFPLEKGKFQIQNLKRGVSIIGSAGSGKTESVVYSILMHLAKERFCGIIHDYKDHEITEMAYPLFAAKKVKLFPISFDRVSYRVNPIAPRYLPNEASVNEVARVLIENLLEQKESGSTGASKFFSDAAEGLICGLIWRLKTDYPDICTLPHLIATYQTLDTKSLIAFLNADHTSRAMADAFISGKDSERQTAGVKSTLANALKKISTRSLFMALSADEVPLDINCKDEPVVISVINNPQFDNSFSPIIATIIHTAIKQMSTRNGKHSFLLMEEAPTIRLLNMHRIPATLRSYDIATIYVMQDKIQNDLLYGDKASRAILSNLSYQFFGKVNDPDTAKYYERFFEIIKNETTSINRGYNLDFDTRVTTGEREVSKRRANVFFRLKQGEFVAFADGEDKKIKFRKNKITRGLPTSVKYYTLEEMDYNFQGIYREVANLFDV